MVKSYLDADIAAIGEALGDVADAFAGKTVLLGGGRGFLGRCFLAVFDYLNRERFQRPCRLIVLDNMATAGKAGEDVPETLHCEFRRHDVGEPLDLDGPLDFVVNAAGIASPYYYRRFPLPTLDAAIGGTRALLDLAVAKHARFTFFSSSEVYGDPDPRHVPTPESYHGNVATMGPRACYDESKRLGETLCHIYHGEYGVATSAIRPFNVFGPGMWETDYRVLPNFATCIKAGRPLKVYGSGAQTRTFCYVSDAMNGFLRVIAGGVPGEAYNIGNPEPEISMVDLVARIEKVLGREIAKTVIEYPDSYRAIEPMRRCPDISKAMLELDYHPRVGLDEGLGRYLAWTEEVYTGEG